jgi:hypothetical protein
MAHLEIVMDNDPMSPRVAYCNLGTMLYTSSRYNLGDKQVSWEEIDKIEKDGDNIVVPVYAYIHSGVVLNTVGFSCPWDSGKCGIIYISKQQVREHFDVKRITAALKQRVIDFLKVEVEVFSHYLSGEVYGYQVIDDDQVVDSCYGFYFKKDAEEAGNEALEDYNGKLEVS